jgi:hypothetical protein
MHFVGRHLQRYLSKTSDQRKGTFALQIRQDVGMQEEHSVPATMQSIMLHGAGLGLFLKHRNRSKGAMTMLSELHIRWMRAAKNEMTAVPRCVMTLQQFENLSLAKTPL